MSREDHKLRLNGRHLRDLPDVFARIVEKLQAKIEALTKVGIDEKAAREVLDEIAETIGRETVVRGNRVIWPTLGTFRPRHRNGRTVSLAALKATGNLHPEAPDEASVPPTRRIAFKPSRRAAIWRDR